ncbi:cytochrome C biogenesis protein CcdA [Nocardioides phosphati]|uniref:Cytochrome C biogenesis protein CcdA n=1 Tax=Nocardioides phosphati TaxID=1867775 RepID=A0ABQ2NB21_9ACTN|nr:cytochrome c biogenesis protein CcdA [Nocardioides phosphati]GGO85460.1 cytochrome C biogenesis protein CcdA [Nocardioides phosphati]
MSGLLALAFGAGLLAPVNPCGFGLLPAVLTATSGATGTGTRGDSVETAGLVARLAAGLRAGLALAVGFTATFTVIGLLLTVGVRSVITLVPWIAAALGAALALIGLALLAGWHPALRLPGRHPDPTKVTGTRRLVAFGSGYAIASASCTLAVLLAVVTQAAATTWIGVIAVFTAYAAGSALLLVSLALLAAGTATALARSLRAIAPYASRIAGALLASSGLYLLYYWLPQLLGAARPSDGGVSALSALVSSWMSDNQLAVVIAAGVILVGTAATTLLASRPRTPRTPRPRAMSHGNGPQ